jgi:hypothetical protein
MTIHYELIQEPTGGWAVFDATCGVPVMVQGQALIGLSEPEAQALLQALIAAVVSEPVDADNKSAA